MSDEVLKALDSEYDEFARGLEARADRVAAIRDAMVLGWREEEIRARSEGNFDMADEIGQWIEWFEGGVHASPGVFRGA